MLQLPVWQCHKKVQAARIEHISEDCACYTLMFSNGTRVVASEEWFYRHKPVVGGYFVRYEDGYESFSPADAFVAGYSPINELQGETA